VMEYVEGAGLDGIWDVEPLLKGNELMQALPGLPQGPGFKEVNHEGPRINHECTRLIEST
jgi:hypothetical protein